MGTRRGWFLGSNWYSVCLIAAVAWVANYLHFTRFGLYSDDWCIAGLPFTMDARTWIAQSLWPQLGPPRFADGRPLQLVLNWGLGLAGSFANSFSADYLVAYLLFAGSAVLMYRVLLHRFSRLVSTLAALLFVLTPLHTLRQFLNGQYTVAPAFILIFIAMVLYLRGRRPLAYAMASLSLLIYESMFFLFLGAPLLRRRPAPEGRTREWLVHLGICTGIVAGYYLLRGMLAGEARVSSLPLSPAVLWLAVRTCLFYSGASFGTYLYALLRSHEASLEAWVYLVPFAAAAGGMLYAWTGRGVRRAGRNSIALGPALSSLATGAVFLVLGYIVSYFFFQEPEPHLYVADRETRVSVAASFGSSIFAAALLGVLLRWEKTKLARLAASAFTVLLLAVLFLYSFVIQSDYADDWNRQREDIRQAIALTPDVRADSLLVLQMSPEDTRIFSATGGRRRAIGLDRYFYDDMIEYVYDKSQPLPRLFIVYSDQWAKYLKRDPDGFMSWTQARFDGRWFPATSGRYRPGRFITLEEVQPGWVIRRSDPIMVGDTQIVQTAQAEGSRPLWGNLKPTRLMAKVLEDFAWKSKPATRPPEVVGGLPPVASRMAQIFTFTGRDRDGYDDIYRMYFLVNGSPTIPKNTCHGFYDRESNAVYLYNDALTAQLGPIVLGSSGTLQNSQCSVDGGASFLVSASGTDVTIKLRLGLKRGYADAGHNVYFWVKDYAGHDTGWIQVATWARKGPAAFSAQAAPPNHLPTVVTAMPVNPRTNPQTFTFTGRDLDGYADISRMYFLINSSPTIPQNTCHGFYDRATNSIYLYDDAVRVAMGPLAPGSAGTLQNSQCSVWGKTSSLVSAVGSDVTITLGLKLKPRYSTVSQNIYFWTQDNELHNTGWIQMGTWQIN